MTSGQPPARTGLNKGIRLNLYDAGRKDDEGKTREDHLFGRGPRELRPVRRWRAARRSSPGSSTRHRKERRPGRGGHGAQRLVLGERTPMLITSTHRGGTHLTGFRRALTCTLQEMPRIDVAAEVRHHAATTSARALTAVVSVKERRNRSSRARPPRPAGNDEVRLLQTRRCPPPWGTTFGSGEPQGCCANF